MAGSGSTSARARGTGRVDRARSASTASSASPCPRAPRGAVLSRERFAEVAAAVQAAPDRHAGRRGSAARGIVVAIVPRVAEKGLGPRLAGLVLAGLRRAVGLPPAYPGDFVGRPSVTYAPQPDGRPDRARSSGLRCRSRRTTGRARTVPCCSSAATAGGCWV